MSPGYYLLFIATHTIYCLMSLGYNLTVYYLLPTATDTIPTTAICHWAISKIFGTNMSVVLLQVNYISMSFTFGYLFSFESMMSPAERPSTMSSFSLEYNVDKLKNVSSIHTHSYEHGNASIDISSCVLLINLGDFTLQ